MKFVRLKFIFLLIIVEETEVYRTLKCLKQLLWPVTL